MLVRLIIFAILIWFGLKLYRRYKLKQETLKRQKAAHELRDGGVMVRCAYCQVHLPKNEALTNDTQWFCCEPHRQKFLTYGSQRKDER
ncbi:PP0621 family protein [Phytohalomonas tamaricis]|uniref:PP0621 family protein n=1 Tax=Phytohalomonas tamaricis TaxID=2081032 RepID=UPI000D0ACFF6|nr:PP0621 family protein [Phytohalomonas tamaricis]